MPTTYVLAPADVTDRLAAVMAAYHPLLAEAGVKVGALLAENPEGDAVKHGGYPALATISVVSLKDRVTKGYDAELLIDLSAWGEMTDRHRDALLDHELSHLERVPNTAEAIEGGELPWRLDDIGRPKLKIRKGDWGGSDGFRECVRRHGEWAVEFLNLRRAMAVAEAAKAEGEADAKEAA